jgi:hypothetical protein
MNTRAKTLYSSLLREVQTNNIGIPVGDRGEQVIANLILTVIASQLYTVEIAKAYIAQAHAIVQGLAVSSLIYRPLRPSKLARLVCDVEGDTETLLLPIINNTLVVPAFNVTGITRHERSLNPVVSLIGVEIARFMLRLRTRKLETALRPMRGMTSGEELAVAANGVLRECLYNEIKTTEPLRSANDLFMLARDLIGRRNFALAKLALENADGALEIYMRTTPLKEHPAVVQKMKEQIGAIINELRSGGE